jgi:N-acyl-D-aspartate/D-glutamate deacylase
MTALAAKRSVRGALGFSTSRTMLHRVPDGAVPGTYAAPDELLGLGDLLGRHDRGTFEVAPKLGELDGDDFAGSRAEVTWMAEINRRTGRPVTFGLAQTSFLPDLHLRVLEFVDDEAARGGQVRPQTTARSIGRCSDLTARSDSLPSWRGSLSPDPTDGSPPRDDGRRAS